MKNIDMPTDQTQHIMPKLRNKKRIFSARSSSTERADPHNLSAGDGRSFFPPNGWDGYDVCAKQRGRGGHELDQNLKGEGVTLFLVPALAIWREEHCCQKK